MGIEKFNSVWLFSIYLRKFISSSKVKSAVSIAIQMHFASLYTKNNQSSPITATELISVVQEDWN